MLISEKYSLIFISNPKTGTTSIQNKLLEIDKNALQNNIPEGTKAKRKLNPMDEHINVRNLSKNLSKIWNNYRKVVFIRNPYEKAVSAYFFYKNGNPIPNGGGKRRFIALLNIIIARILPFQIWVLFKPIKMNIKYVISKDGFCLVNYVGDTKNLEEDFIKILKEINIFQKTKLNKKNTSSHSKNIDKYFSNLIIKKLFEFKYKHEIIFYNRLKKYDSDYNLFGKKIM